MRARLVTWALLILLALSGSLYGLWQRSEAQAARTYAEQLESSSAALRGRLTGIQPELQRQKEVRREADQAIQSNPDWATEPVPAAVSDGLCKRLRCR